MRGLVDLGALGPMDSLGVRRPVGPLCSSGCRGVESEDGGKASINQVRKNSLNIKFLDGIFLDIRGPEPRRRDIPDKNFMQVGFFLLF